MIYRIIILYKGEIHKVLLEEVDIKNIKRNKRIGQKEKNYEY